MVGVEDTWQEGEQNYRAFLLRCWQESELENGGESDESFVWRFALVQLDDRSNTNCLTCLEELVDHLRDQLSQAVGGTETTLGNAVPHSNDLPDEIS